MALLGFGEPSHLKRAVTYWPLDSMVRYVTSATPASGQVPSAVVDKR